MAPLPQLPVRTEAANGPVIAPRPAAASTPDPAAILRAFQRRWPLALGGGLLLGLVAGAATYLLIPAAKYTAVGILQVRMVRPKILFTTAEEEAEYQTFQKTQMTLVKSRFVLDAVIRDPAVAGTETLKAMSAEFPDPTEWLERDLVVDFSNKSEILQVSMSGKRPKDLEEIVNKVIEAYMKMVVETEKSERNDRVVTLRTLWDHYQENLKAKRDDLRKLALTAGSDDRQTLAVKNQLAHEQLAMAEAERMRTKSELARLQAELSFLEGQGKAAEPEEPDVPEQTVLDMVENDHDVQDLKAYLQKAIDKYSSIRRTVRNEADPSLVSVRNKIDSTRSALASRRAELKPLVARRVAESLRFGGTKDQTMDVKQMKAKVEVLKQFGRELAKDAERLKDELGELNKNTLDLQTQQEEVAVLADTAKKIKTEVESMDVELKAPARIRIVNKARAPVAKDNLKKAKASAVAALGAFACVLFGVTFWEARARRVGSTDEVVNGLGMRIVGSLPTLTDQPRRRLPGARSSAERDRGWHNMLVDSVDATRTMLLHASRTEGIRTVMVTSAVQGEGKTSLAGHLAASLARAGRNTLLVDSDLRRPAAHKIFDVPLEPGFSELLRGEADLAEVTCPTQAAELHIIPAGRGDAEAVQALSRGVHQQLFEEMKGHYDFIVVDSPPVLPVVDTLVLSQHVDAVLFSILCEVSRMADVEEACGKLNSLGVRILGAVVAGTPGQSYRAGYDYFQSGAGAEPASKA